MAFMPGTTCGDFLQNMNLDVPTQDAYRAFCTNSCLSTITDALDSISSCVQGDSENPMASMAGGFGMIMETACVQDDAGNYCGPVLGNMGEFNPLESDNTDQLDIFCGDCFMRAMTTYAEVAAKFGDASGNDESGMMIEQVINNARPLMDAYCSKNPNGGGYCLTEVAPALNQLSDDEDAPTPETANTLCSPCGRRVVGGMLAIASSGPDGPRDMEDANLLRFGCNTNPGGDRCLTLFTPTFLADLGMACEPLMGSSPACPSDCKTALQQKMNDAGCCFMPVLQYFAAIDALPVELSVLLGNVEEQCGVTVSACAAPAPKAASARLTNVKYSWAVQNRATFESNFKNDIATLLVIDPSQVTITGIREGSVIVDFTVTLDTAADTTVAAQLLDESIASGTLNLPSTFEYIDANKAAAVADASLPIGVDTDSTGDSAAATPAFALAGLLAVAAAAMA